MQAIANKRASWRIIDIINWGEEYFDKNGFESPKQEIEWLLCDLLNYKRVDLYVNFEEISLFLIFGHFPGDGAGDGGGGVPTTLCIWLSPGGIMPRNQISRAGKSLTSIYFLKGGVTDSEQMKV